jgi:hypothetical protein
MLLRFIALSIILVVFIVCAYLDIKLLNRLKLDNTDKVKISISVAGLSSLMLVLLMWGAFIFELKEFRISHVTIPICTSIPFSILIFVSTYIHSQYYKLGSKLFLDWMEKKKKIDPYNTDHKP